MSDQKTGKFLLPGSSPFAKSALYYASLGFCPIPIIPGSKKPYQDNWPNIGTTEPEILRQWNGQYPKANVGIITGKSSGIVVLDIDRKEGKEGEEHLDILKERLGPLPDTIWVISGAGGWHLYFAYDPRLSRSWKPYPDVELKSDGSQVVAPPSIHPDTKRPYAWEEYGKPGVVALATLPTAWIDYLSKGPLRTEHGARLGEEEKISEGQRNDVLFRLACHMRESGATAPEIETAIATFNDTRLDIPLPASEIKIIAMQAAKYKIGTRTFFVNGQGAASSADSGAGAHGQGADPEMARAQEKEWYLSLDRTDKGQIRKTTSNLIALLEHDPEYEGKIRYNQFWNAVFFGSTPMRDDIATRISAHLEKKYHLPFMIGKHVEMDIIDAVARDHSYHPVRDWLNSLVWDRTERLKLLFSFFFGADDTPYVQQAGKNFLTGAVARIMNPGCKVDTLPILEGPQGTYKSQSLKVLFGPEWTAEMSVLPDEKDFAQNLLGKWCLEFAELDAFSRSDEKTLKRQLSTPSDHYRPSYGRFAADFPRQSIFAGTTNETAYLKDPTGSRRFWPIKCGRIRLEEIQRERDQLFAEALIRFRDGEPWWHMPEEETREEQELRTPPDMWEDLISEWVEGVSESGFDITTVPKDGFTVHEMLGEIFDLAKDKIQRQHEMRASSILHKLGFVKIRNLSRSDRKYYYYKR